MNLYQVYLVFDDNQLSISGVEAGLGGPDRFILSEGVSAPNDLLTHFRFKMHQRGHQTDVLANNFGWIIASPRLVRVFESTGCNVQTIAFGSEIIAPSGTTGDYHVVNVLNRAEALDTARSVYREEVNDIGQSYIGSITKLVVREQPAKRMLPLFRLAEYEGCIVAGEEFVQCLQREQIKGVGFEPIESSSSE